MQKLIEELIVYSKKNLLLNDEDVIFVRNLLMHELNVKTPFEGKLATKRIESLKNPDYFVSELEKYYASLKLDSNETKRKISYIFGIISPRPSVIKEHFESLRKQDSKLATDWFYDFCIKNYYIQKSSIDKNTRFNAKINNYDLEITINLSKPEKTIDEIKAQAKANNIAYPRCVICPENEGNYGNNKFEPRTNLRMIPLMLNGKQWYLQYSPYGYYNEHCIVIDKDHIPMGVSVDNLKAMADFIDLFPHYFLGSNADLPIVGGSILSHNHFQGGRYELPLMRAKNKKEIKTKIKGLSLYELSWPTYALKVVSKDREKIISTINKIHQSFSKYSDKKIDLISDDGEKHNTSTIILKKEGKDYIVFLIPRNNRTDEEHPTGIFHVRNDLQIIKQENIGLIEAMGMFILPARLSNELVLFEEIAKDYQNKKQYYAENKKMKAYDCLIKRYVDGEFKSINDMLVKVGDYILHDISVFKDEESSERFIKKLGL